MNTSVKRFKRQARDWAKKIYKPRIRPQTAVQNIYTTLKPNSENTKNPSRVWAKDMKIIHQRAYMDGK